MDEKKFETPILLITYNRLDTVKEMFEEIRAIKPVKLYVASDGPKKEKQDDEEKILAVRNWIEDNVDWECQVFVNYSKANLGCQLGVVKAIDWIFEHEEMAIILEDDILANNSFFLFCQEMLQRYKNDERVMLVSGYKPIDGGTLEGDYFFSDFGSIWGWATWKRAWNLFDVDMKEWPEMKEREMLKYLLGKDTAITLGKVFDIVYEKKLDAWDYPWQFAILLNSGLGIVPRVNLIRNIGFGGGGTHTFGTHDDPPVGVLRFPLKHEKNIIKNWEYDDLYIQKNFKVHPIKERIRSLAPKKLLNVWYKIRLRKYRAR